MGSKMIVGSRIGIINNLGIFFECCEIVIAGEKIFHGLL